jgi:hypothetical protein
MVRGCGWMSLILLQAAMAAGAEVGEFSIPSVSPLSPAHLERLRALVTQDSSAKSIAEQVTAHGRALLDAQPQPLEVIHYEGLVNTDPRRVATVEKLREMGDVARLMRYWQISGDERAAAALQRFILAWTRVYRLTGNDVNENKLYPLLVACHALRDQFSRSERDSVDRWVKRMGQLHEEAVRTSNHFTNRYSKHVRLLATCGMVLGTPEWVAAAHEGIRRFVTQSLRPDGTSLDLERRDALGYHQSALAPVVELAMLAGEKGRELYTWTSPAGGSVKKSVDYLVPYAMGEKTHEEWVNSKVDLDRRRAAAGIEHYQPGRLYEAANALQLMAAASLFDSSLLRVVRHLTQSSGERFPTWETLVNEAARGSD